MRASRESQGGRNEREEGSGGVIDAASITAMIGIPGNRSTISPRTARHPRRIPTPPVPRQDIENYPGTMAYTRSRIAIRSRLLLIYAHNTH